VRLMFRVGLVHEGNINTEITQVVCLADDIKPTEIMDELRAWADVRVHASYDVAPDDDEGAKEE
jgi:hypothetical protein